MKPLISRIRFLLLVCAMALFATPCLTKAQDSGNSSTPEAKPAPANPAPAEKKKPKKVWTNDEIGSVGGQISVVGTQQDPPKTDKPASVKAGGDSSDKADLHQKQVDRYKDQMKQYQAQIDDENAASTQQAVTDLPLNLQAQVQRKNAAAATLRKRRAV